MAKPQERRSTKPTKKKTATTTKKKRTRSGLGHRRRSGLFRRQDARDVARSLEHILVTGCQVKEDAERRKEFRRLEEAKLEQQHCRPWVYFPEQELSDDEDDHDEIMNGDDNYNDNENNMGEMSTRSGAKTRGRRKWVLQEDVRVYGEVGVAKDGFSRPPWPSDRKRIIVRINPDKKWELEHGDSIHPLAFAATRLSERTFSMSAIQDQSLNGGNLNISTTDTSLEEEQVPRALLHRCWQRAVHIASQSIPVRVSPVAPLDPAVCTTVGPTPATNRTGSRLEGGETSTSLFGSNVLGLGEAVAVAPILPSRPPLKESPFLAYQREIAKDPSATELKCISLDVALPRILPHLNCPVCFKRLEHAKALREHYYGGAGNNNPQGCCWRKITEKQTDVIAQVMESHVKAQIDEFLGLVMDCATERIIAPVNGQTKGKRRRLLNWHDILKFAVKTIHTSHLLESNDSSSIETPPNNETHPVLETLQRKSNGFPLCLNPTILETVRQRLVDRYANLPR